LEQIEIPGRLFQRLLLPLLINRLGQYFQMTFHGHQVERGIFHAQLAPQIRVHHNSALRVYFYVGPEILGIEQDVFRRRGVLLERVEELLVYAPFRDRIDCGYAAVQTRQIQFALREAVEKLYKIRWKFEPGLIVELPWVPAAGYFDACSARN